jgi:hypothetical protein
MGDASLCPGLSQSQEQWADNRVEHEKPCRCQRESRYFEKHSDHDGSRQRYEYDPEYLPRVSAGKATLIEPFMVEQCAQHVPLLCVRIGQFSPVVER